MPTAGIGLTVSVTVAVSEQPSEVPTTVYVVVLAGLTVNPELAGPPIQEKAAAPEALSVWEAPAQIAGLGGFTVTFGIGFTCTVTVFCDTQPSAEVTQTV